MRKQSSTSTSGSKTTSPPPPKGRAAKPSPPAPSQATPPSLPSLPPFLTVDQELSLAAIPQQVLLLTMQVRSIEERLTAAAAGADKRELATPAFSLTGAPVDG